MLPNEVAEHLVVDVADVMDLDIAPVPTTPDCPADGSAFDSKWERRNPPLGALWLRREEEFSTPPLPPRPLDEQKIEFAGTGRGAVDRSLLWFLFE